MNQTVNYGIKLLLIDEDVDFIQSTSLILESNGFQLISATSGISGVLLAIEKRPDVVVINVMFGKSDDGFTFVKKIRKELGQQLPIVLLSSVKEKTGYASNFEEYPDFLMVNKFIEKPVSPASLMASIKEVM